MRARFVLFLMAVLHLPASIRASEFVSASTSYLRPTPTLTAALARPDVTMQIPSGSGRHLAELSRPAAPPLERLQREITHLAGLDIDIEHRGSARHDLADRLTLVDVIGGRRRPVSLPAGALIADVQFSPDERWLAVTIRESGGASLWLVDINSTRLRRLMAARLNTVMDSGFQWFAGSSDLLVSLVTSPSENGNKLESLAPRIQESSSGSPMIIRTFPDFLKDPIDDRLFDRYTQRTIAKVALDGRLQQLLPADRYLAIQPSPDGRYLIASRISRPYPRNLTIPRFPRTVELWESGGRRLEILHRYSAIEASQGDEFPSGPRDWSWRSDQPATLQWFEREPGQDHADRRDYALSRSAPFDRTERWRFSVPGRIDSIEWLDEKVALVRSRHSLKGRLWRMPVGETEGEPKVLWEWSLRDPLGGPGRPLRSKLSNGELVLTKLEDGVSVLFVRWVRTRDGVRIATFALNSENGEMIERWRSDQAGVRAVHALLEPNGQSMLLEFESQKDAPMYVVSEPNGHLRRLMPPAGKAEAIAYESSVQLLRYVRADGLPLSARLHLPKGYVPSIKGPLPLLMWIYPREYLSVPSASELDQSAGGNISRDLLFPAALTARGYAVLEYPSMPIVGSQNSPPGDHYVSQLVMSAQAAVDEVVRLNVADRNRIAVGGHSWGASAVATLLAQTRLFAAGVALSGAYNRSLTPFGFQSEKRSFWEAPAAYRSMSAFDSASQIEAPLLLVHGLQDISIGATPMQSERMFDALRSLGKPARLVMLPSEGHFFRAAESQALIFAEMECWLDRFVMHQDVSQVCLGGR